MRYMLIGLLACVLFGCSSEPAEGDQRKQFTVSPEYPYQAVFSIRGDRLSQRELNTQLMDGARIVAILDGVVVIETKSKLAYSSKDED
jgi:uncharacterized protein YfdQ (DUF2303 family)